MKSHLLLVLVVSALLGSHLARFREVDVETPVDVREPSCLRCKSHHFARLEALRKDPRQAQQFQDGAVAYLIPFYVLPNREERKALRMHRALTEPKGNVSKPIAGQSYLCLDCEYVWGEFSEPTGRLR